MNTKKSAYLKLFCKPVSGSMTQVPADNVRQGRFRPIAAGVFCFVACYSWAAHPEDAATTGGTTSHDASAQPRNAFAETLRPKAKRPTVFQNQPYNPIKHQDDQGQIPEIEMFVGESRLFPAPGVARIAVGNGQLMTAAALDNKEIIIFANGVGTSSLFVWNEDGRYQRVKVNIVPGDTTRIAREVAAFLTTIPHTKASIVGDKVIVEGDNLSDADLTKIEQLEKRYPQIVNFTNRLGWEPMVMMDVKVVEFPVDQLRDIGMKWSTAGGAAIGGVWRPIKYGNDGPFQVNIPAAGGVLPITTPGSTDSSPLPASLNILGAFNLGLNAQLNLLAQNGKASILAEPQLAARSGSKASFLAGGEFPYSVSSVNGVTIIFKPYGIKLDIQPKVDRNGVIRATIDSEVSKIDPSISTVSGPALLTRKTNTEFNVKSGETMVLSGLIQVDSSTNIDKVPLLGEIPVLGALFRSKRFQNKETELVVFVTPTVVDSKSPDLVDRVERVNERLQQELGRPPYLTNPLQPGHDPAKPNAIPVQPAAAKTAPQVIPPQVVSSANLVPATRNPLHPQQPMTAGGSTLRVKREGLVLRAEPDVKSAALLQLGYGAVVQLGAVDVQPPGIGHWRNVVVGAINGWVLSEWVEPSHLQATIQSNERGAAARPDQQGRQLTVGRETKGGGAVIAGVQQVTPAVAVAKDASGSGDAKRYRVTVERLALRVTPDVNAPVIQRLPAGQVVEALPQPPKGYWVAVEIDGVRGWTAAQWLHPLTSSAN
ncbi:MAG: pilus assembly protein N-terminal domain-containing protein [Noviherbaspirillum sp.]